MTLTTIDGVSRLWTEHQPISRMKETPAIVCGDEDEKLECVSY